MSFRHILLMTFYLTMRGSREQNMTEPNVSYPTRGHVAAVNLFLHLLYFDVILSSSDLLLYIIVYIYK